MTTVNKRTHYAVDILLIGKLRFSMMIIVYYLFSCLFYTGSRISYKPSLVLWISAYIRIQCTCTYDVCWYNALAKVSP